jgi:hypothetical protein
MLLQGAVRPRPSRNRSQAHPGVQPLSSLTHRTQRFQPLPPRQILRDKHPVSRQAS